MTHYLYPETVLIFRKLLEPPAPLLDQLKEHHFETFAHSLRVGLLSIDLGLEFSCPDDDILDLGLGGLYHDIGKLTTPRGVLEKNGSLNPSERNLIRAHPKNGYLLLDEPRLETVRKIVISHHELKKEAYPRSGMDRRPSTRGAERRSPNPELTEIVAVADIYDAMKSMRSYKAAMEKEDLAGALRAQFTGSTDLIDAVLTRYA